jgi:putative spermidine/putrescine transport system ATP-binding protein
VVYVTHDQAEALTMSDRIAVFNGGIVQQLSTPAELYEKPANAFVAQFIGENNRLRGEVRAVDSAGCAVALPGGAIVRALPVQVSRAGEATMLSVRPERVSIGVEAAALPNVFDAQVEELFYLGDHIRARVSVCGSDDFILKIPNAHRHARIGRGETVRIGWTVEDCRALDA